MGRGRVVGGLGSHSGGLWRPKGAQGPRPCSRGGATGDAWQAHSTSIIDRPIAILDADIANCDLIANANIVWEACRPFPRRPIRLLEISWPGPPNGKQQRRRRECSSPLHNGLQLSATCLATDTVSVPRFGGLWRWSFEQFEHWAHTLTTTTLRRRPAGHREQATTVQCQLRLVYCY